jgi:gas vesicle protein
MDLVVIRKQIREKIVEATTLKESGKSSKKIVKSILRKLKKSLKQFPDNKQTWVRYTIILHDRGLIDLKMPYEIVKMGKCYQVVNKVSKDIKAKCTTKTNAKTQVRILESIHTGDLLANKKILVK